MSDFVGRHGEAVDAMLSEMDLPARLKPLAAALRGLAGVLDAGLEEPAVFREFRLAWKELLGAVGDSLDPGKTEFLARLGGTSVRDSANGG